jgi:hypothetical protein
MSSQELDAAMSLKVDVGPLKVDVNLPHAPTDDTAPATPSPRSPVTAAVSTPPPEWKSYEDADLSPSSRCGFDEAEARMSSDKIFEQPFCRNHSSDRVLRQCIYFLYGRRFEYDKEASFRISRVASMVETAKKKKRLAQFMNVDGDKDVSHDDSSRRDYETFNKSIWRFFEKYVPAPRVWQFWKFFQRNPPRGFGFLENMMKATYFLRQQTCGNCYLHAPCTLTAYQMQRDFPNEPCGTVDISKFARHTMTDQEIWDHVVEDAGGSSITQLRTLLKLNQQSDLIEVPAHYNSEHAMNFNLEHFVEQKGPGLVSCFKVHENFAKWANIEHSFPGIHRFDGGHNSEGHFEPLLDPVKGERERLSKLWPKDQHESDPLSPTNKTAILFGDGTSNDDDSYGGGEESIYSAALPTDNVVPTDDTGTTVANHVYHSMVLLGGYVDANGKHWFLLQNWWQNMPLVLVSTSYLMACQASFAFLTNPIEQAPDYAPNLGLITECSFPDRCDRKEAAWPKKPIRERK